ncbi:hypothetical protein HU200_036754 [Digitaria exilis]|uniref:Uncharacterized protein n=1 Tax=Digitaria exilis TaxID=1010633 RepID=A0A835BFK1_9POAL|nr:hypothetical protein HU200_036754 [Digitaria exilis]
MSDKFVQDLKDDTRLHCSDRHVVCFVVGVVLTLLIYSMIMLAVWYDVDHARAATANVAPPQPKPNLFIRLEGVEGLNLCDSPPAPPAFHLVVDADWIPASYRYCSGGCNSMLRVSYHGMILTWGPVPWFCVEGNPTENSIDGVVTVEAKAGGVVLREEVRNFVQSELDVVGKAEFDVEGEVKGLGYLRCKTLLFKGNATEEASLCLVQ